MRRDCRWCRHFRDDGHFCSCGHPSLFIDWTDDAGRTQTVLREECFSLSLGEVKSTLCRGRWWRFGLLRAISEVLGL